MNNMDWVNIPAGYLLVAYLSALIATALACPGRCAPRRLALSAVIVGAVYSLTLFSSPNAEGLRFFACMSVIWAGMPVFLKASTDMSWRNADYCAVRAFFLGDFIASLSWQLVHYAMTRVGSVDRCTATLTVFVPVCIIGCTAFFLLERRLYRKLNDVNIQRGELLAVLCIGVFFYFMANISYVLSDSPFSAADLPETYVLRTLTEFGAVAILLAFHIQLVDHQNQRKAQAMENALRLQGEHYKAYETSIALVNQKYHDLKHQIRLLRESVATEERQRFVEDMERELSAYEVQCNTGNVTLDTILTATGLECSRAGIDFTCVADGAALSHMHPLDLNALFGNLLDNAMECENRISNPERRMIHVTINRIKTFAQIRVRNICEEPVRFHNGLPLSSKNDERYHGFGTQSVQRIVEAYNGSIVFDCEDGWFEASVLIPIHLD